MKSHVRLVRLRSSKAARQVSAHWCGIGNPLMKDAGGGEKNRSKIDFLMRMGLPFE